MIKYLKIFIFSLLVVVQIAFAQGSDNPNEEKLVTKDKKNDDKSKTVQDTDREKLDAKFAKKDRI